MVRRFDVIVVGAGHAGCEAAAVAARMGARTAIITLAPDDIGAMSCNPAIGGIGKGHLVREVDIFDGLMARAADHAGIHYRMLNRSKGTAVQGPRVQADRKRYRDGMQQMLRAQPSLEIIVAAVEKLRVSSGRVEGVSLDDGTEILGRNVILATGTFLGGQMHCGSEQHPGGRNGARPSIALAAQLRGLDLPITRLKTGTPPRLDGRTIDWSRTARQPSDPDTWQFSPIGPGRVAPQIACAITKTNGRTHDIIRGALPSAPISTGAIQGRGPRYCPSIEDKIARFGDREGHQIFLEPEGLDTHLVYPNGISTSLPSAVQQALVNSITGLERATIVRHGYAVEYDHLDPRILTNAMEVRSIAGLYCAGQINGTTGYEEAAAQGLVSGINAAAAALERPAVTFDRTDSYIGVMIDDLTLQGVTEPYRMLTARAEFRLRLRSDNAGTRLGAQAISTGGVGEERQGWIEGQAEARARTRDTLASVIPRPRSGDELTLADVERAVRAARTGLEHPDAELSIDDVARLLPAGAAEREILRELLDDLRYAPYVARQLQELARIGVNDPVSLAGIGSYATVRGLSSEMIERLDAARPSTLGEAARVRGITPAALSAVLIAAHRRAA